jgi:hypothetical protein
MSYNTKNYTEQGGEKTVIGGTLEFKEGASIVGVPFPDLTAATETVLGGIKAEAKTEEDTVPAKIGDDGKLYVPTYPLVPEIPVAENQAASAAATLETLLADFNALVIKLKDSSLMEKDLWDISVTKAPIDREGQPITENQNKVEAVTIDDNIISVTVDVDELVEFDSSNPAQGIHKWVGILITTGLSDITKIKYNGYQLTQDDVTEAAGVGGSAGDIIMWLKCDEIVETPKLFTLWAPGFEETEFVVEIVKPGNE